MPCDCCGCCVIDAAVDYTKTQATCGSCVQVHKIPPEETTQASCESTYDGCLIGSEYSEVDGAIESIPESECAAGSPAGQSDCGLYIVTDDPSTCPDGWFYSPLAFVSPTASGCYSYHCVASCDDCDDLASAAGAAIIGCADGVAQCVEANTFTKHYGVWTGGTWYVPCKDYVAPMSIEAGPGTELKSLLAKFGIHATPNCKCNKMAKRMNAWGPDECLNHIEEIVDVMEEEAKKRSLPFLRTAGRLLVRKAIRNARGQ